MMSLKEVIQMSKTFKQYDSRWGKKNYNGSSTMAAAGCGPSSVAMIGYNMNTKLTPWTVAQWMKSKGYAIRNAGTAWAGIPAALKAFGCQQVKTSKNMAEVWKELGKGDGHGYAIFLFGKGKRGGVRWTGSGHYIAVTDYKIKNGKHWLYTRDSYGPNTGWHSYEDHMKGLIKQTWTCYVPMLNGKSRVKEEKPADINQVAKDVIAGKYGSGELRKEALKKAGYDYSEVQKKVNEIMASDVKKDIGQKIIEFAATQEGKYATRSNKGKDGKQYTNKFIQYFEGKGGIKNGNIPPKYGYIEGYCTVFACYCYAKNGISSFTSLDSKSEGYFWHAPVLLKWCKKKGYEVKYKDLKPGDLCFKGKTSATHTCLFLKKEGDYIWTWDGNVGGGVTKNKRKKSSFVGYGRPR